MRRLGYIAVCIMITVVGTLPVSASPAFSCADVTTISQIECEALVALYYSTGGTNWTNRAGWLSDNNPGNWFRVVVSGGHVTELTLYTNNLSGPLPAEIGNLTNLTSLLLTNNHLSGNIPAVLGNLTSLVYLHLDDNQFTGNIPTTLGNLPVLKDLYLDNNQFMSSIPPELGNLANLDRLSMYSSWLIGPLPEALGNLPKIREISLFNNDLSGSIPASIGNLATLQVLWLHTNHFDGDVPGSFVNLTTLFDAGQYYGGDGLTLDNNYLTVPQDYPDPADSLQVFLNQKDPDWYFHQYGEYFNCLSVDEIPQVECEALKALYWRTHGDTWYDDFLWLASNFPSMWEGVGINGGHVTSIYLGNNDLMGTIPPDLANLSYLTDLRLNSNQLSGFIPSELGNLTNLQVLHLDENYLGGNIPNSFVNLTALYGPGAGPYGADGLDLDFNYLIVPPGYPDPDNPLQVFLSQKDLDWQLTQFVFQAFFLPIVSR